MKHEIKILIFIRDNMSLKIKEICSRLNIDYEKSASVFRHLENQEFIALVRGEGRIGPLRSTTDPYGITTNGIKHLEQRIPQKIKFWSPVILSTIAIIIAIIALFQE